MLALAGGSAHVTGAVDDKPIALDCGDAAAPLTFALPADDRTLAFVAPRAAWLELKEDGQSIDIVGGQAARRLQVRVPPRYSWSLIPLEPQQPLVIRRFDPGRATGAASVRLHCKLDAPLQRRIDWFRDASAISGTLRSAVPEGAYPRLAQSIAQLSASAPDAAATALATHLHAQALLMNGNNADASQAFVDVESAWEVIGEGERALAARVGQAEDAVRSGHYDEAIHLTQQSRPASATYFSVRLDTSRCLSLWYLGQLPAAGACYETALAAFASLGEQTEYASVLQAYAELQSVIGAPDRAEWLARRALAQLSGPYSASIAGRLEELLGNIAMARGAVAEALAQFDRALAQLEAGHVPQRWIANVEMRIARIYEELGAHDEALDHLQGAMRQYTARDSPARLASAMLLFAQIEADLNHIDSAILWSTAAETTYANLQMPAELSSARLKSLQLRLQRGNWRPKDADAGLRPEAASASERTEFALAGIDLALRRGEVAAAREKIDQVRGDVLTLRQRVRLAQLEAQYWHGAGADARALHVLAATADQVAALARATSNPALAAIVERQLRPLNDTALELVLLSKLGDPIAIAQPNDAAVVTAWTWVARTVSDPPRRAEPRLLSDAELRFDRAVAEELLAPPAHTGPGATRGAQRELLTLLADRQSTPEPSTTHTPLSLAVLQSELDPNAAMIAYVSGEKTGALLWVTKDSVRLCEAGAPADVRASAAALRLLLRSPASSMRSIEEASDRLSRLLLRGVPQSEPPRKLYVLAGSAPGSIPWALLRWRDSSPALVEQSVISLVRFRGGPTNRSGNTLHVIVASQTDARSGLPNLPGAAVEAKQIAKFVADRRMLVSAGSAATRTASLAALNESGAWVHVAAHGTAEPRRLGFSGVWLEAETPAAKPEFLSWLDVLESGVNADLVVLDACDLDATGDGLDSNPTFAASVANAGARRVVAALWPVSDAAASIWVPEFYSTIHTSDDAAAALQAAQQRLRASSAFRHPFFWAGLQVTEHLAIPNQRS